MSGFNFTCCTKSGDKMNKLDQFLVTERVVELFPDIMALALEKSISDHRPITLKSENVDYDYRCSKSLTCGSI